MDSLIDADDPRYAPLCGTYSLEDGRCVFIGGLLGAPVVTLHEYGTRRIGTLAVGERSHSQELVLRAGPSLFEHEPVEVTCAFRLRGTGGAAEIDYREAGAALRGARIPLIKEAVHFTHDDVRLAGTLFLPPDETGDRRLPCVVLIHGSGPQTRACVRLHAEHFARHGIAALAYDKRGAGESPPGRDEFPLLAGDALAGVRLLARHPRIDSRRIGLCGSSQGGWIAPLAAAEAPDEVAFVVLVAGPAVSIAEQNRQNTEHSMRAAGLPPEQVAAGVRQALAFNELIRTGEGWDEFRVLTERARAEGWERYAMAPHIAEPPAKPSSPRRGMDADPVPVLERLRCPVLALYGGRDTVVPASENAPRMEAALRRGAHAHHAVAVLPDADHLFHQPDPHGAPPLVRRFLPEYLDRATQWIVESPALRRIA